MPQSMPRAATVCAFALLLLLFAAAHEARAQSGAQSGAPAGAATAHAPAEAGGAHASPTHPAAPVSGALFGLEELREQLRRQGEEIELLRAALKAQARALEELGSRVERAGRQGGDAQATARVREAAYSADGAAVRPVESAHTGPTDAAAGAATLAPPHGPPPANTGAGQGSKATETASKAFGSVAFSGDIRLRFESFFGQQNTAPSVGTPGALGNPLSSRHRLRVRARLAARGQFGEQFEWGLRLSTGPTSDATSGNQTLTNFFSRKNFELDRAFIVYRPEALPGLEVQGGKFETPWWRTELTWDNDISPEGLSERYTYKAKSEKGRLRELSLLAWQLPFLERNAALVVGADGRVDFEQSRREGRDLALYGAQARVEFAPTADSLVRLAAADHYFSGTQFINPAQFFGNNITFPVVVNVPASPGSPARTVTGQVSIPRELLNSGNFNLGLSAATTNALNRDGRLASGFNLVDLYGHAELNRAGRWPLLVIVNYVRNTQARDVVTAGPAGADLVLENNEDEGLWAEFQIGRDLLRNRPEKTRAGDLLFNYTFMRIEKDAVLTPFNFSNLVQQSDVRGHRFAVAYALDPRVALSLTGIVSRRAHGLLGPFATTPQGSLDRTLTRIQLDTIFRF
ncbi:MAG TPA: putative porin [Pyrinomonadaceae bacterium]|nr:putative porin [Pyrinomonadaceae bacterium]